MKETKKRVPEYTKSGTKKTALMLIAIIVILVFPANASGYIAESAVPSDIDIAHKCDKPGLDSCYDLGLQAGLFDGYQYHGQLRYSVEGGCNGQNSPNFCFGYFMGFSKTYGHPINNTEIWNIGNNTGSIAGSEQDANPKQITCDVSALFCKAYIKGYTQAYIYNIPYWIGLADGQNFADLLIKSCHEENHPKIPGNHSQVYKSGWIDGYNDEVDAASNDDGTYGENCHEYY
jgi:hypothetical protein